MLIDENSIIQRHLQELVDRVDSCTGAIASTADGHLIARAERQDFPGKRLAAMGSTLMALGNTITRELAMGKCRNVIAENEQGIVVFLQISHRAVLVAASADRSSLGLLLSAAKACIERIQNEAQQQAT